MRFRGLSDFGKTAVGWTSVAVWTGAILMAIPCARAMQALVERSVGPRIYLASSFVLGLGCAFALLVGILRGPRDRIARRVGGIILLGALSTWVLLTQLQTPAESFHFVEYGILGYLLFRAWRHHVGDLLIYPIAVLNLGLIACLDEFLQWLMPGRFWDFRDIRLNAMAGAIVLLAVAYISISPGIRGPVARRSVRWLCILAWAMLLALGLALSNTPTRVDRYASRLPFLGFLRNNESVMNEFGYRHVDPEIGTFYSRLLLSELIRIDNERGAEVGEILRRSRVLIHPSDYGKTAVISADPFRYELFKHLLQRDHYAATGGQYRESDPARYRRHFTVAFRENQILEKYFPHALDAAGCRWSPVRRAQCSESADERFAYVSDVNHHLVSAATELELWSILLVLAGGCGWGYVRYGRETGG